MVREVKHGKRTTYVRGCRCDPCKEANRKYTEDLRDRKRTNKPVLTPLRSLNPEPEQKQVQVYDPDEPGRVESAVQLEINLLTQKVRETLPGLIASALAMARDIDNPALATSHPSSQRQLMAALSQLHNASVGRKGKLADVAQMANRGEKTPAAAES
jgi:hypothetical protein